MPKKETITVVELITSLRNEISGKMEAWEELQEVHNKAHVEAIQNFNKIMETHVKEDKTNFGELGDTLSKLNETISGLQATVEGLRGSFIPWPWFIGTMISLLVIVGGAIIGVYAQLNDLGDRLDDIEFVANLSE